MQEKHPLRNPARLAGRDVQEYYVGMFRRVAKRLLPHATREALRRGLIRWLPGSNYSVAYKHESELAFWRNYVAQAGTAPETDYYRQFMMRMGNITAQSFFDGKVCLDIGCGPKGSLTWLTNARAAIGLDPLAESYCEFGIANHRMLYLVSAAEHVPLLSSSVDVVFSMNSLDHVDELKQVCREIRRVLKPGGHFIASLNLDEPRTATEPWTLTEELLHKLLFAGWEKQYYEIRPRLPADGNEYFAPYKYFFEPCPPELMQEKGPKALWCRFQVPVEPA